MGRVSLSTSSKSDNIDFRTLSGFDEDAEEWSKNRKDYLSMLDTWTDQDECGCCSLDLQKV